MSLAKDLKTFCMKQKSFFSSKKAKAEFAEKLEEKVLSLVGQESGVRNHRNCTTVVKAKTKAKGVNKPTVMTKAVSEVTDGT